MVRASSQEDLLLQRCYRMKPVLVVDLKCLQLQAGGRSINQFIEDCTARLFSFTFISLSNGRSHAVTVVINILDFSRVFLCLIFLVYASWSDFKKREVSNKVWAVFAPLALVLTSIQVYVVAGSSSAMLQQTLIEYGLSFSIIFLLSYLIFYFGAFGGADAKALMCIAVALPTYPASLLQPKFGPVPPFFPLTVFSNGVLFAALSVFYALTRNVLWKFRTGKNLFDGFEKESKLKKTFALLSGYKIKAEEMDHKPYLYPLEDTNGMEGANKKLIMMPSDDKRQEVIQRLTNGARRGELQDEIWVTPGLPLLVFITAGFVVAIFLGDFVWIILRSVLIR